MAPVSWKVMMLYASLSTMTAVIVHGKRGSSRSAAEARSPRIWLAWKPNWVASKMEKPRLVAVRVYSPQRARQAARSRAAERRSASAGDTGGRPGAPSDSDRVDGGGGAGVVVLCRVGWSGCGVLLGVRGRVVWRIHWWSVGVMVVVPPRAWVRSWMLRSPSPEESCWSWWWLARGLMTRSSAWVSVMSSWMVHWASGAACLIMLAVDSWRIRVRVVVRVGGRLVRSPWWVMVVCRPAVVRSWWAWVRAVGRSVVGVGLSGVLVSCRRRRSMVRRSVTDCRPVVMMSLRAVVVWWWSWGLLRAFWARRTMWVLARARVSWSSRAMRARWLRRASVLAVSALATLVSALRSTAATPKQTKNHTTWGRRVIVMFWPVCQARRFPPAVAAAMTRAWGRRRARRRMNSANHAVETTPMPLVVAMLYTTLGARAAVVVHGRRGSSSSVHGARKPMVSETSTPLSNAGRAERHRPRTVRVYSPQRARQAARSRAAERRSAGGDRDGIGDLSGSGGS